MATVAGLLAASGLAATADAASIRVSAVNWDLRMNSVGLYAKLRGDCLLPAREEIHWIDFQARNAPFKYTTIFQGTGVGVSGSFDPAARTGSIAGSAPALRFDNFNAHSRAIRVGALGLKVSGDGGTVTGRIERTRTIFSRFGPAKPLLGLKGITLETGPFQRKGKDVADTLVIALQGRATVLPALARELTRIRCRGPHIVTSHPIRAGAQFGLVRAQLRPDAATGIGGTFELDDVRAESYDGSVTITPTAPATQAGNVIRFDLPADQRTPLRCAAAYDCAPDIGAQFALGGGFVLAQGARSATVADLSVAYADVNGRASPVVSGTIDGTPLTLMTGSGATQEFEDRAASALGTTGLRIDLRAGAAHFAKTATP